MKNILVVTVILISAGLLAGCSSLFETKSGPLPPMPEYNRVWEIQTEHPATSAVIVGECTNETMQLLRHEHLIMQENAIRKMGHRVISQNGDADEGRYYLTKQDRGAINRLVEVCLKHVKVYQYPDSPSDIRVHVILELTVIDSHRSKPIGTVEIHGVARGEFSDVHDFSEDDFDESIAEAARLGRAAGIRKPSRDCLALPMTQELAIEKAIYNAVRSEDFARLLEGRKLTTDGD